MLLRKPRRAETTTTTANPAKAVAIRMSAAKVAGPKEIELQGRNISMKTAAAEAAGAMTPETFERILDTDLDPDPSDPTLPKGLASQRITVSSAPTMAWNNKGAS